ncbi:germinal center-associated signaling and motility protein [Molossus molossus]|uniref:Germinal center associated signaling and motility n=1 Tax=Molossus molossus TaxID=27622 RepID=A0A7J8I0B0_MOLMO|nr:germinal center-associated signaling and motility protein [Molossus molossus]KAF6477559.1 germinal center associated signaling and motility [Molossus molossus]
MGNSLLRENRCWDRHIAEGCFCLPWKKIDIFKARRDYPKESEGTSSTTKKDNADQSFSEELCYALIDHSLLGRMPSGNSAEGYYENVLHQANRPRESLRGSETEYSLLSAPSTHKRPPSPEDEYELLTPSRISSHILQQPQLHISRSEAEVVHV